MKNDIHKVMSADGVSALIISKKTEFFDSLARFEQELAEYLFSPFLSLSLQVSSPKGGTRTLYSSLPCRIKV